MKVLFVCRSNGGRSKSAELFFRSLTKDYEVDSAGTTVEEDEQSWKSGAPRPKGLVRKVMKEYFGIDMSNEKRKQLTPEILKNANRVVVILDKEEQKGLPPYFKDFNGKLTFWEIKDMRDEEDEKAIKDRQAEIRKRVEDLIKELG